MEPQAHSLVIGQQKIVEKIKEFVEKLNQILTIQVAQREDENSQAITESHGNGEFYNNGTDQIGESKVSLDSQHLKCGENLMEKITLVSMLCGNEKLEEDVEENQKIYRGFETMFKTVVSSNLVSLHEGSYVIVGVLHIRSWDPGG